MENTENIRPQLLADMNSGAERPMLISAEAYNNLATVTRDQLTADIGIGAMNTWQTPFLRYAAHEKRRREKSCRSSDNK